jgi:hypothetical protein
MKMEIHHNTLKFIGYSKNNPKRQIHSNLMSHFEELEREQTKSKVSRSKEITIGAEINETETRKTIEKNQ